MWWWSSKPDPPISSKEPEKNDYDHDKNNTLSRLAETEQYVGWITDIPTFQDSPISIALVSFTLGSVFALTSNKVYVRYFKRIRSAGWVTPDIVKERRWLKGFVVKVGDGDGFHLYHTPSIGWSWPLKFRHVPKKIRAGETISIRIAGVDAPEKGHFGNPTQPYAEESIQWLKSQVLGKRVYCQVGHRDQHNRIVAIPMVFPRFVPKFLAKGKCISLELLRAGYGVTYEKKDAYYGGYAKEEYQRYEALAKEARKGMWENGTDVETPTEYKRRYGRHAEAVVDEVGADEPSPKKISVLSLWKR